MERAFQAIVRGVAKAIKPEQLRSEIGGAEVYTSGAWPLDGSVPFDVMADVPQATLDAAVTAHIPNSHFGLPAQQITDIATIKSAIATNPALAALVRHLKVNLP